MTTSTQATRAGSKHEGKKNKCQKQYRKQATDCILSPRKCTYFPAEQEQTRNQKRANAWPSLTNGGAFAAFLRFKQPLSALQKTCFRHAKCGLLHSDLPHITRQKAARHCTHKHFYSIKPWCNALYACTLFPAIFPPKRFCFSNNAFSKRHGKSMCKHNQYFRRHSVKTPPMQAQNTSNRLMA